MVQISNWFFLEFVANSYIAVTVKRHAKIGDKQKTAFSSKPFVNPQSRMRASPHREPISNHRDFRFTGFDPT